MDKDEEPMGMQGEGKMEEEEEEKKPVYSNLRKYLKSVFQNAKGF